VVVEEVVLVVVPDVDETPELEGAVEVATGVAATRPHAPTRSTDAARASAERAVAVGERPSRS